MMTGTETMNQHTILATRLGDLTVLRNAEAVVGLYFPHRVVGTNGALVSVGG